jgi:hypothetical protein
MSCGYLLEFDDVSELIRLHYNLQEYTHKVMMSQARKICDRKECPLDTKESAGTPNSPRDAILQALARGYCAPKNSGKELDSDLIYAMADELAKLHPLA